MISFGRLGQYGRLGNQLFQYAFLRTQAERLGVKFFCPPWLGDDIFELNDREWRAESPEKLAEFYEENNLFNYDREKLSLQDETEILGFYESEMCSLHNIYYQTFLS